MRVLLDFDGSLARVADFSCAVMSVLTGEKLTAKKLVHYDTVRTSPEREAAFWKSYDLMDEDASIRAGLAPFDGHVADALSVIAALGHDLEIVTANNNPAYNGVRAWLQRHTAVSSRIAVYCIGRRPSFSKATLGYDVLIDDNPKLAAEFAIIRRFRSWAEVPGLVAQVTAAHVRGNKAPVLLLPNTRWNENVQDRGDL